MPLLSGLKCFCCVIKWQSNWCSLVGNDLNFSCGFSDSLLVFKICHFNYDVFWCRPLWGQHVWDSGLPGVFCLSFTRLGKFVVIISSNGLLIPCSLSSPSGIPMMQMLHFMLMLHFTFIIFFLFFSFCYSAWVFFTILSSKSLIWSLLHLNYFLFLPVYYLFQKLH